MKIHELQKKLHKITTEYAMLYANYPNDETFVDLETLMEAEKQISKMKERRKLIEISRKKEKNLHSDNSIS